MSIPAETARTVPPDARPEPQGVTLRGLRKTYGTAVAVGGVDLDIEAGRFAAILGPSGCGKSTVLGMIGGFVEPTGGEILIGGRPIVGVPPERRPTAMVFQTLALFPHLTVAGNVAFGLRVRGVRGNAVAERVRELLDLVQLGPLAGRRISELSGGQQQRVAIARALAVEPAVLLLDEPLSALDAQLRKQMQIELRSIQQRTATTFVYVTHDQQEAMSMADQVVVMREGAVEQSGSPLEVYTRPRTEFVARFLGDANVISSASASASASGSGMALGSGTASVSRLGESAAIVRWLRTEVPATGGRWAIRPEAVTLTDDPGDTAPIRGTVVRSTYYGATVRYEVEVGLEEPLVVVVAGEHIPWPVGAVVGVGLDPRRVVPLQDGPA
ncbi:ABC transporter ATP-binding protein [Streptosporangium sp. NPDC051023]|uniref:ABC transporter ATP-binding protein n=1 Tax=Streptosporangium sp. NPDC051023 TaxID=3155410 RepID=UPI00344D3995